MIPRRLAFALLLFVVTVLVWWLAEPTAPPATGDAAPTHTPDYVIERFAATSMGLDGMPKRTLKAESMAHYPDDDSTELMSPRVTVYDKELPPWTIDAEKGWVSGDGELLLLRGQVNVNREGATGVRPVEIVTTNLRVHPSQNFAETEDPIRIRSAASWVNGTGMKVWFGDSVRLQLLNEVKGQYEIN